MCSILPSPAIYCGRRRHRHRHRHRHRPRACPARIIDVPAPERQVRPSDGPGLRLPRPIAGLPRRLARRPLVLEASNSPSFFY
jgi:hypothetical protein